MDWNRNGMIDASDILTTELFEEELGRERKRRNQQNDNSDENCSEEPKI